MKKIFLIALALVSKIAIGQVQYGPQNNISITGQAAQTATVNNIIPATSGATGTTVTGYNFGSIQIVSTGTGGTFIFESSNSDANYLTMNVYNNTSLTGIPITAAITPTASTITYYFPVNTNFIRVRIATTITGGSIQALTKLVVNSPIPAILNVAQPTAANLNVTASIASTQTLSTVTTVGTVTTLANGQTAHSSASTGSPLRAGGRVAPATPDLTLAAGDASDLMITNGQQLVVKPYAPDVYDWTYAAATAGILNTTTAVTFKSAAAASTRNYITAVQVQAEALGAATELAIRDGAAGTVLWRIKIGTAGLPLTNIEFDTPLKGTAATLLEVVTLTASTTGAVYFNAQGYIAP